MVFVEAAAAVDPPLITREIGRDEVKIQVDLMNGIIMLLTTEIYYFGTRLGRFKMIQFQEMDGKWLLFIGLGGAIGELWVQDGLLLMLALGLSSFAGYKIIFKK